MIYPLANLFGMENWMVILVIGLLLFGSRLPEVGRSLGKGIVEFKKGLNGIEDEIEEAGKGRPQTTTVSQLPPASAPAAAAGYKFDPYTGKPLVNEPAQPQMRFDPYTGKPITQDANQPGNLGV